MEVDRDEQIVFSSGKTPPGQQDYSASSALNEYHFFLKEESTKINYDINGRS